MSQTPDPDLSLRRTQTTCLILLTVIAVSFALYFLQSVLLPFVIALFIVAGCRPILDFLETRCRLHWTLAFAVTFMAGVALLAGFSLLIFISINDLAQHSDDYNARITEIRNWAEEKISDFRPESNDATGNEVHGNESANTEANSSTEVGNGDGVTNEQTENDGGISDGDTPDGNTAEDEIADALQELTASFGNLAQSLVFDLAGMLTNLLSYGVLIMIFVFFLLLGRLDKQAYRPQMIKDVDRQVRKYIVMKTVISVLTGLATTIVLWIFGVPLAIVFGMLACFLNFIPNIGPLISMLLPIPFLVLNPDMSLVSGITVFVLICAIQFISGNVIETRVMGKSFDVSPVVLLLALMFFGLVWGIVGMFLATPIVSIIKIILSHRQGTRPMAELLAGRWERPESA